MKMGAPTPPRGSNKEQGVLQ